MKSHVMGVLVLGSKSKDTKHCCTSCRYLPLEVLQTTPIRPTKGHQGKAVCIMLLQGNVHSTQSMRLMLQIGILLHSRPIHP